MSFFSALVDGTPESASPDLPPAQKENDMLPEPEGEQEHMQDLPLADFLKELNMEKFCKALKEVTGCETLDEIVENVEEKSDLDELKEQHKMKPAQLNRLYKAIQALQERKNTQMEVGSEMSWITQFSTAGATDKREVADAKAGIPIPHSKMVTASESESAASLQLAGSSSGGLHAHATVDNPSSRGPTWTSYPTVDAVPKIVSVPQQISLDKIPKCQLQRTLPCDKVEALMNVVEEMNKGPVKDKHLFEILFEECFEYEEAIPYLQECCEMLKLVEPSLAKFCMDTESRWLKDLEEASPLKRPQLTKKFEAEAKRNPHMAQRIWDRRPSNCGWLSLPERCNYLHIAQSSEDQYLLDRLEDAKEIACILSHPLALEQQKKINDHLLPELRKLNEALHAKWVERNRFTLGHRWVMEPSNTKRLEKADKIMAKHFSYQEREVLLDCLAVLPEEAAGLSWEQFCKDHLKPEAVDELKRQTQLEPLSQDETEDLVQKLIDLMEESEPLVPSGPAQRMKHLLWKLSDFAQELSSEGVHLSEITVKMGLSPDDGIHLLYQAMTTDSNLNMTADSPQNCEACMVLEPIVHVLPLLSLANTILKEFAQIYYKDVMAVLVPAIVSERLQSMEDLMKWLEAACDHETMTSGVHRFLLQLSSVHWDQMYGNFSPEGPFRLERENFKSLNYVDMPNPEGSLITFHVRSFGCSPIDDNLSENKFYKRACDMLKKNKVFTVEVALAENLEKLVPYENMRKILLQELQKHTNSWKENKRNLQVQLHFAHGSFCKPEQSQDGSYQYDLKTSNHSLTYIAVSSNVEGAPEVVKNLEDPKSRLDFPAQVTFTEPDAQWPRIVKCGDALPPVRLELSQHLKKFKVRAYAAGCQLEGADMVGRDGVVEARLRLQYSDTQQALVFPTTVVFEVQDGPIKGMQRAFPPIDVQGIRVSQSKNECGRHQSAVTSLDEKVWVQYGVPFRLGVDFLVPMRGQWWISVKDTEGTLRQVDHAERTRAFGIVDLVFPEGQICNTKQTEVHVCVEVPCSGSDRHGRTTHGKKQCTSHDLVFPNIFVHRAAKVRSSSWGWAPLHNYKPDDSQAQLQEFSADTLDSFPMLLPNGNEIRMLLNLYPTDGHESAKITLRLECSQPLPQYHLVLWLHDGPRVIVADKKDIAECCHNFRPDVEIRMPDLPTFYIRWECLDRESRCSFSAEPFLEEFQDISNRLGEMKPCECLAKLGELGFSQDGRERQAHRNLDAACKVAETMGLDMRRLRRPDLLVLFPWDLEKILEDFVPTSQAADDQPVQQVNRFLEALDPLLQPTWSVPEPWSVKLGLYHLMNGVRAVDPLRQILGTKPWEPLGESGERAEAKMRFIAMCFHNKFQTPEGSKEIADLFQTSGAEEGEDKGDDAWSILTNSMQKLYNSILETAARHGATLPRAFELRHFEEFRLSFPEAAEEKVLDMGHNQVVAWCKKFEGVFEDITLNERHSVDLLFQCIKRLRNEPRWPPAWPFHIVLDEPRPCIRVTAQNGAHSRTLQVRVASKANISITEAGIIQQNYFLRRSKNVDDAECGFELERNPAGKPLEIYFRDLKEAPQSEIFIELDEGYVALKWREQPPRATTAPSGFSSTDCDYNIILPCHATDVTHLGASTKRVTFKRFLLKITGNTSCQQLKDFLRLIQDRALLKRKYKGGWFETAEQLKDIMEYILNPIPSSSEQGPGLVYNFSPTLLECLIRARVSHAHKHCREAVGLHSVALEADETKRELVKVLIPNEDGERVKTLVFEPNRWKETPKYVEALKSMGVLVEAYSLDLTSLDTFLQWLQKQQSVTAPWFVCVRVTGKLSLSDLARVHKTAANNEALSVLLQVDQHVAAALYMTGILRDPSVVKVNVNKGMTDEMVLFRSYQPNGEPGSDVGCCVLCAADAMETLRQRDGGREKMGPLSLAEHFEDIAQQLEVARQIYPFSQTRHLRLIHGDVDAAREALREHSGDHMEFIDVAADLDLHQCINRISSSEQVTEVIVFYSNFLSDVQKRSLLEEFGAKPHAENGWARDRVSLIFVSPSLHPVDFELGPEAMVQWATKPLLDRRKQINRVLGALRLVMSKEVMTEVDDTQGLSKMGEQDDVSQQTTNTLEAKISSHLEYMLPQIMKEPATALVSVFMQAAVDEVKKIENLEQDEEGIEQYSSCAKDGPEAVRRLAQCAVRVQGIHAAQDRLVPFHVFRERLLAGGILSQKDLVEAWASNIFAPLWVTTQATQKRDASGNSSWTPVGGGNPLQSSHLLLYFMVGYTSLPQPGYLVMQKDPISTERDAFMERLMRGEDVDYNEVPRIAQFPWGHQCFMHMLSCCSPHMVPMLVVLVPVKYFQLILWNSCPQQSQAAREAFKRLKQMVLDPLLCKLSEGDGSFTPVPLAQHIAVARWCILKVEGPSSTVELRDQDINTLFEMGENVSGIKHMASNFPFLVPRLLALDAPRGFVYQQLGLRQLLQTADIGLKDLLFDDRGGPLGANFLEFLLHPKVPRDSRSEVLRHPFSRFWQNFIDVGDLPFPIPEVKELLRRMTPAAFCQVAESCTTQAQLHVLMNFVQKHISADDAIESLTFWSWFLDDLLQRTFPLKLRALDVLCLHASDSFCQAAQNCTDTPLSQSSLMMQVFNKKNPGLWREHVGCVGPLPLLESEMLTNMVMDKYGGMWSSVEMESQIQVLMSMVDKEGFQKLFRLLPKCSLKFLAWANIPTESIALYANSAEDISHLNKIVAIPQVGFKEQVQANENTVSFEARFLCKRVLPRDEFVRFAEMIGAPKEHIDHIQRTFVICQKNHEAFSPYILHARPWALSADEFALAGAFVGSDCSDLFASLSQGEPIRDIKTMLQKCSFDVSSGFSHATLKQNLIALLMSAFLDSRGGQAWQATKRHIQSVLWCWFQSFLPQGVDPQELVLGEWLHIPVDKYEEYWPADSLEGPSVSDLTLFPLPAVANVSFQAKSITLFESRRESASCTLLMFQRLAEPFMHPTIQSVIGNLSDITSYIPPIADDLLGSKEQNGVEVLESTDTYELLPETWITQLYAPALAIFMKCPAIVWQSASTLVSMLRIISPFAAIVNQLALCADLPRLTSMFDALLAVLTKQVCEEKLHDLQVRSAMATVHRALHLLLGMSKQSAVAQCQFLKSVKKSSLEGCLCKKTMEEITYVQKNTDWFNIDSDLFLKFVRQAHDLQLDPGCISDFTMNELQTFIENAHESQKDICSFVDEWLESVPDKLATTGGDVLSLMPAPARKAAKNPFKVGHRNVSGASDDLAISREPLQELVQSSREDPAFVDCEGFMEVRQMNFSCTVVVVPGSFARLHECDSCGSLKLCGSEQSMQYPTVQQDSFACRICKKNTLRVITDFPSHGHAYEYLIRQPEGLTLLLPGLLLVRRGDVWLHLINSEKLTDNFASGTQCDIEMKCSDSHESEEGPLDRRYFFYQLLDTKNFLHLHYLNRAGMMFDQILFPLALLFRKIVLSAIQRSVFPQVHDVMPPQVHDVSIKSTQGELLDWLRQFEVLPTHHELRVLFRSEHRKLTQAIISVAKQVTMATTIDHLRSDLKDAHPIFGDQHACDSLQNEASFFDTLRGFLLAEDSRNLLCHLLDDATPKHPAQTICEESFEIIKMLGGECPPMPDGLEATLESLRGGQVRSGGNGSTGWRSIVAMQPVDDVSGDLMADGGQQWDVQAREQLEVAAYEKVHSVCGPPVDDLFCQCLDPLKHHAHYTSAEGLQVSYMLPVSLLCQLTSSTSQVVATREGLDWVVDLLRSPMQAKLKEIVLYDLVSKSGHNLAKSAAFEDVKNDLQYNGNQIMEKVKHESPDDKWVLHGLQQACPFPGTKSFLSTWTNGLGVGDKEQQFARRRRGRYGIHFVPLTLADRRRGVPKVTARVEKVQLRRHFKTGLMAAPAVFKLIECSFTANCHFVAVFGLSSIPDELLKWLAEFTAANPWRIVFLMDTDASLKLPENLDRCIFHGNTRRDLPNTTKVKLEPANMQILHTQPANRILRRANRQWKQRISDHLDSDELHVPLQISGGPGIGKTHTAGSQIRNWSNLQGCKFMTLDGSSPALINSSLSDFLECVFTKSRARKIVMVVDEWHTMIDERKRQALQFFLTESRVIPILLSNRYDSSDEDLLNLAYGHAGFQAHRHIVVCSLTSDEYISIMTSNGWLDSNVQASKERVSYFLEAVRMMFGDEVIGFSMREDLKQLCEQFENQKEACLLMGNILDMKVPYLDPQWRDQALIPCLYEFMRPVQASLTPAVPEDAPDFLGYLLPTARWHASENMASYIEYVRDHVPNSFKHHPHHLIFSYVLYRYEFAGVEVDRTSKQKIFQVCCRQNVVGLPMLFPRVLVDPKPADEYATVVCQEVDPSNLSAIIHSLKRGMSPDWTQCKACWKMEGITDVEKFIQLVSVWPDTLHYVDKQNLFDLLESSGAEGMTLARSILNEMSAEPGGPKEPMNLYYMAAWWCYRFQEGNTAIIIGDDGEKRFAATQDLTYFDIAGFGQVHKVNLQSLLSWASANACHHTTIFNMKLEDFTEALKSDLLTVSRCEGKPVLGLWDQQFAFLLSVGDTSRDVSWQLMANIVEEMSRAHHPPAANWPEEARALSELWEGRMHPPMAEFLAVDSFFSMLRLADDSRTNQYICHLFRAVQEAQQPLPAAMQEKLLRAGLLLPDELAQASLVRTLLSGLRLLQEKQLAVNMPPGSFRTCLKEIADGEGLSSVLCAPKDAGGAGMFAGCIDQFR